MADKISTMLWYDQDAEGAAQHYVAALPDSKITSIERYGKAGPGPEGAVMLVSFNLCGREFSALNGGPRFTPNESMSHMILCEDQAEVDRLWDHFSKGGSTSACGWVKDKWGHSWQITPRRFMEIMRSGDAGKKARAFEAMLQMTKFDIAKIEEAVKG